MYYMKSFIIYIHILYEFIMSLATYSKCFLQFRSPSWWITMHLMHLWQSTISLSLDYLVCSSICSLYSCLFTCHLLSKIWICFLSHVPSGFLGGHEKWRWEHSFNIGKLEYKTKHGKKPGSFLDKVFPRDVKSAFCLLVNLFLEQPKVKDEDSNIRDSFMKSIKTSAVNEGFLSKFLWKG